FLSFFLSLLNSLFFSSSHFQTVIQWHFILIALKFIRSEASFANPCSKGVKQNKNKKRRTAPFAADFLFYSLHP
ncbi:MAG: hypothetical protein Q8P67_16495, partial [archaeon]|nr:hypothetical protein [archaeon]